MDIERQLLFAVFALRGALIDLPTLLSACRVWRTCKDTPLAEVLLQQGALLEEDRAHLDYLLQRHLEKQHGNTRESLALVADAELCQALDEVGDADLAASVAGLLLPPPIAGPAVPTRWLDPATQPPKIPKPALSPRYLRRHVHAQGGIGQVWLAHDTEIDREVALKELRPETVQSSIFRERFLEEARVTGQLEHPGIVPVHDLVQPTDGTAPYYIMRFVKGRTLSQAVDAFHAKLRAGQANRVDLVALINAFHAVCNALAFAHARGVLHRDLKGQNVILGDFGEVFVLDWGLSRRLETPNAEGDSLPATRVAGRTPTLPGQIMGTPGYMAPEQAAGRIDRIDARTDVYGLGAILYEILTGRPPFTTTSLRNVGTGSTTDDLPALLRRIQTEAPQPPRTSHKEAPAALEAICLKALARHPELRYASAAELGQEVQRWLADEPVQAYREPLTVRLGRWGRRHKLLVTGVAVLLVCAVVGLTASTLLLNHEREQTEQARTKAVEAGERAKRNFQLARDVVTNTVYQISEQRLLQEPGLQPLRQELLRQAKDFFDRLVEVGGHDPLVRSDQGQALLALSLVTSAISERQEALSYLQEAEAIFTALQAEQPQEQTLRYFLGRCHLRRGYLLLLSGQPDPKALAELEEARKLLQTVEATPKVQRELAVCANLKGDYFDQMGTNASAAARTQHFAQALTAFTEAERLWQVLLRTHPHHAEYRSHLGGVYQNLGKIYQQQEKYAQANEAIRKSWNLHAQLVKENPDNLEYQHDLGSAYGQLAICLFRLQRPGEAAAENQNALRILEPLAHKNPTVILFQTALATVYGNLADQLRARWPLLDPKLSPDTEAEIRGYYQKALQIYQRLHKQDRHEKKYVIAVATTYTRLGNLAFLARKDKGLLWYQKALDLLEPLATEPDGSGDVRKAMADCYWGRAAALQEQGEYAQAVAAWDRFFDLQPSPPGHPLRQQRALSLYRWAGQLAKQQNYLKAANQLDRIAAEAHLSPDLLLSAGEIYCFLVWQVQQSGQPFLAERLAGHVVALWQGAQKAGALQTSAQRLQLWREYRGLEVLSRRPDFQRLVRE